MQERPSAKGSGGAQVSADRSHAGDSKKRVVQRRSSSCLERAEVPASGAWGYASELLGDDITPIRPAFRPVPGCSPPRHLGRTGVTSEDSVSERADRDQPSLKWVRFRVSLEA